MITSSSFVLEHTQHDGRRYVTETHILNVGNPILLTYLSPDNLDYNGIMLAHVPVLNSMLSNNECEENLKNIYDVELAGAASNIHYNHVLRADFIVFIRVTYKTSTQNQCAILGNWLKNNVTDAEAMSIFSITSAQLTALKTKFTNDYNKWAALKAVAGQ